MLRYIYTAILLTLLTPACLADVTADAVARAGLKPPTKDPAVSAAAALHLKMPIMCREYHIWWGAPLGQNPSVPAWTHWKGLQRYGQFDPTTTIEETVPGLAWRRYLNCVGYPLLGPYDPGQPDIIRWQLQTAQNAGMACLWVHLWPSIWGEGEDYTPLPVFERVLEQAAALKFPVGLWDEISFRGPELGKAQTVDSSIRRIALLIKRYGKHPGVYKIDGMPVYQFQNWNHWISAPDLERLFTEVEKQVGPVYWIMEMNPQEDYVKIPQLKALVGGVNAWFLHTPPFGAGPHPWEQLRADTLAARKLARQLGKKFGVNTFSRFNNGNDRGGPGKERIDSKDGAFFLDSLKFDKEMDPDFIVLTQWNDFEECAFLEPGWDFDGWNGDPYRYCRMVAAAAGKTFTPAPLPKREQVDPYIRHKLYGDTQVGDMGPVFHYGTLAQRKLTWKWAQGSGDPASMRVVQAKLPRWRPGNTPFGGLRLANVSEDDGKGTLAGAKVFHFYAPPLASITPQTVWLGIRAQCGADTGLHIDYRANSESYRSDSADHKRNAWLNSARIPQPDGTVVFWMPLYGAQFSGWEGDITLSLDGARNASTVSDIMLWRADLAGTSTPVSWTVQSAAIGAQVDLAQPFVAVAYDKVGNAGLHRLFYGGVTTPTPAKDPMDLLTAK